MAEAEPVSSPESMGSLAALASEDETCQLPVTEMALAAARWGRGRRSIRQG